MTSTQPATTAHNARRGNGRAVHREYVTGGAVWGTLCAANVRPGTMRLRRTDDDVTCKTCLQAIAKADALEAATASAAARAAEKPVDAASYVVEVEAAPVVASSAWLTVTDADGVVLDRIALEPGELAAASRSPIAALALLDRISTGEPARRPRSALELLDVPCSSCGAGIGSPCLSSYQGIPRTIVPHAARIATAEGTR